MPEQHEPRSSAEHVRLEDDPGDRADALRYALYARGAWKKADNALLLPQTKIQDWVNAQMKQSEHPQRLSGIGNAKAGRLDPPSHSDSERCPAVVGLHQQSQTAATPCQGLKPLPWAETPLSCDQ